MRIIPKTPTIVAVLALMSLLHSCCRDELTPAQEAQIILGCTVQEGTKAIVSNKKSFVEQCYNGGSNKKGFGVYGYKTVSTNYFRLFTNTEVTPSLEPGDTIWSYSPIRFWDSNTDASYQFAAYWPLLEPAKPASGDDPYVTLSEETDKVLTIHRIPNWQDSASTATRDFLVATKRGQYKSTANDSRDFSNNGGKVSFDFNHILAQLIIKGFYVGVEDKQITVNSITIKGDSLLLPSDTATYQIVINNGNESYQRVVTGDGNHTLDSKPLLNSNLLIPVTAYLADENGTASYTETITQWLVVPSGGWQDLSLDVTYQVDGGNPITSTVDEISLNANDAVVANRYITKPGHKYNLILKFNSANSGLPLEAVFVEEYTTVNVNDSEVYNW